MKLSGATALPHSLPVGKLLCPGDSRSLCVLVIHEASRTPLWTRPVTSPPIASTVSSMPPGRDQDRDPRFRTVSGTRVRTGGRPLPHGLDVPSVERVQALASTCFADATTFWPLEPFPGAAKKWLFWPLEPFPGAAKKWLRLAALVACGQLRQNSRQTSIP